MTTTRVDAPKLRYKQGDIVKVKASILREDMIGKYFTVAHVGPWKSGELQPNGGICLHDCDYILDDGFEGDTYYAPGVQVREDNLE